MAIMTHRLKVWPEYFERLTTGDKTFEIRVNDRGYSTGDVLELAEWRPTKRAPGGPPEGQFTGRVVYRTVGFVSAGQVFRIDLGGSVVMSLLPCPGAPYPGPVDPDPTG